MLEQIQQLIALGQTEEALELAARGGNNDIILLQARFNSGKKQYNSGLSDYNDWQRIQNQINYALLDLVTSLSSAGAPKTQQSSTQPSNPLSHPSVSSPNSDSNSGATKGKSVFVSYNHEDKLVADKIVKYLKDNGIRVVIDSEVVKPGEKFTDFVVRQVRENGYVLSLVSQNSLKSGWVGMESNLSLFANLLMDTQFLPVSIDKALSDDEFYFSTVDELDAQIKDLDSKIKKSKQRNIGYGQFEVKRKRAQEHKDSLSKIIEHFQNVSVLDISGEKLEESMKKIVAHIG